MESLKRIRENYYIFNRASTDRVIIGEEGWLFYGDVNDGNTIASYEGRDNYSEDEIEQIMTIAQTTQNRLEEMGIGFALLYPPNKENVYNKYMPKQYSYCGNSRTDKMVIEMQNADINAISPKDKMMELIDEYPMYYTYDTHWNQLGGYEAVCEILDLWNIKYEKITERQIEAYDLKLNYHNSGDDDLAEMLKLRKVFDDDKEYKVVGTYDIEWNQFSDSIAKLENADAERDETLLIVGDSFRFAMLPYFAEKFKQVYFCHRAAFIPEYLYNIKPDYLVAEYVERYSYDTIYMENVLFGE